MFPPIMRKLISRFLMKLPSFLFPNYRVAMNSNRNYSFETCKNFFDKLLKNKKKRNEAAKPENSPLMKPNGGSSVPTLSWAEEVEKELYKSSTADELSASLLLNCSPPLRKITVDEIKSVKLKPISKRPKTIKKDHMEEVLKKRFNVMHSTNNSLNDSEDILLTSELCRT